LTERLGHHASIPLAFAILYQDYRFGFADLFLKRALTLLALITIVVVSWSLLEPSLVGAPTGSPGVWALLMLWIGTAFAFPWLRQRIAAFVDRIILRRANYATVIDRLAAALATCASEREVLSHVQAALEPALSAESVQCRSAASGPLRSDEVLLPTAEEPRTVLTIGRLTGGRRLLSDDIVMLERVALAAARRIDAVRLNDERYARLMREREINALAAEAELRALRAQINPHFLFNALTTLGYLIQSTPNRAFEMLMHLTTLLRSALRSEGEFTTLRHERELVNCYLQIERERFEERLQTEVDVPDELLDATIPSLIVQPLVENAIKHGIARSRDGGRIVVRARPEGERRTHVRITVSNTGAPLHGRTPGPEGGIGLKNVEHRLRCYYGDGASLALATAATGETVAEILVPVADVPEIHEPALESSRP
jgi:LytS/YehU family sensor histidine kinase